MRVLTHIAMQEDTNIMLEWRHTLKSHQSSHEVTTDKQKQTRCQRPQKNHWDHYAWTWTWSFSETYNPPPLNTSAVPYRCPPSLNPSLTYFLSISQKPPTCIRHSTGQLLVCALVIHCKSTCFISTVKVQLNVIIFVFVAENFHLRQSGACVLFYY